MSKKRPLLIVCNLANEKETEQALSAIDSTSLGQHASVGNQDLIQQWRPEHEEKQPTVLKKFLFKCGDDLRQDNLVL